MLRPESPTAADVEIVVECDGLTAAWTSRHGFTGHPLLTTHARQAAIGRTVVEWAGPDPVVADAWTPLGALAALVSYAPRRTRIVTCPADLHDWWTAATPVSPRRSA